MASAPTLEAAASKAVHDALSELVRVSAWGGASYASLPIFMPTGAPATVRIRERKGIYEVDDVGFAYRELESAGVERSFPKIAAKHAASEELQTDRRRIFAAVHIDDLARTVCDVALASRNVVAEVFDRIADEDVSDIEDDLTERLIAIFGSDAVRPNEDVTGASTKPWELTAVVHLESGLVVFQAVANHSHSINRASTAFHDLRELPTAPKRVAVVKDKAGMGVNLNILAQAARVIQSDQADEAYRMAIR